jgi:hypothetical protein
MEYELELNIYEAVEVHNRIYEMAGTGPAKLKRAEIQKTILDTFPEADAGKDAKQPGKDEKRPIKIDKRQMKALAHGIIDFMNKPTVNGSDFQKYLSLAEKCKLTKYVKKMLLPDSVDEFDGDLDDEPELIDEDSSDVDREPPSAEATKEDEKEPAKVQ